jgi:hypothetical protein
MQGVIEKRLKERIMDYGLYQGSERGRGWKMFICVREFIAYNSYSKSRSVADLSHLSDHYDPIVTKSETLEGFSASLLRATIYLACT